jgi:hypothetical protein
MSFGHLSAEQALPDLRRAHELLAMEETELVPELKEVVALGMSTNFGLVNATGPHNKSDIASDAWQQILDLQRGQKGSKLVSCSPHHGETTFRSTQG